MWTWIHLRYMLHWPNMVLWTLMLHLCAKYQMSSGPQKPFFKWSSFHSLLNGSIYLAKCAPQKCISDRLVSKTKLWKLLKHLKSRNFIKWYLWKMYWLSLSRQQICRWNFNGSIGIGKIAISSHYSGTIQAFSELHLCGLT